MKSLIESRIDRIINLFFRLSRNRQKDVLRQFIKRLPKTSLGNILGNIQNELPTPKRLMIKSSKKRRTAKQIRATKKLIAFNKRRRARR